MTDKELLQIRNKIVCETAIPRLLERGFNISPFSTAWNGRNNLHDFDYELCRLTQNSLLELVQIYVASGDRWIQVTLNIFELHPKLKAIEQLKGVDGLQFRLPPNSLTKRRLRTDDVKGVPLFRLLYMNGHKLRRFRTESGKKNSINRLTQTIKKDIAEFDRFVARWNELHQPLRTTWTGHKVVDSNAAS